MPRQPSSPAPGTLMVGPSKDLFWEPFSAPGVSRRERISGKPKMNSAAYYRRLAEQSLAMVELVLSDEAKSTLFSMAQCWHRLAQEAQELEANDRPVHGEAAPN
jgi:hypothetical protein